MTPQELEIQKKMSRLNVRLAKKRNAQMMKAKVKDTESSPEQVKEAKVDKGRSDYGKASIRNYRRMGPGHSEPGMFDPEGKRGKTIDKRREEHKARRGVKGAKVPAYKVEEVEVVEDYETKKKEEIMGALKKRDLKQKVKEKIAADIIKRKGDVSKSDDRYAYESVEVVSEGPLGAIAGGVLGGAV